MAIQTYYDRYKELQEKYKIARSTYGMIPVEVQADREKAAEALKQSLAQYDIVVECIGTGYAHKKYRVVKNGPDISTKDLAIICDSGNLCFGYRTEGSIICVYTD